VANSFGPAYIPDGATKEQLANFDTGVPKVVLQRDAIPETGKMPGRSRLEVIAPEVARVHLDFRSDASAHNPYPRSPRVYLTPNWCVITALISPSLSGAPR